MSLLYRLYKRGLINPPQFLINNTDYEVMMGSLSYGVSSDSSDIDVYGFGIPPKEMIFPHLRGEIPGFGNQIKRFDQYQEHHIEDKEARKSYDIAIYNIVRYFQLCMENNPNMIDSLFAPQRCIIHITQIGNLIRENRRIFLHKGCWHKFKGYAYSQMHKMDTKEPVGERKETINKFGYDIKFAYHVVRLLNEVEQILVEGDIDLERNREQLKSIRRGEWTIEQIKDYFTSKEKELESLYLSSKLPHSPDEVKIKQLLIKCLEMRFGSLNKIIYRPDNYVLDLLSDLKNIIQRYE